MSDREIQIDVRYEAAHEIPYKDLDITRPQLTWGYHPEHGNGWMLWYIEDPNVDSIGVSDYFIPGDLTDVDSAVESAREWLAMVYADDDDA